MAGLACSALADGVYSYQSYLGTYTAGGWVDLLWPLGAVLLAFAAWQPARSQAASIARGWRGVVVPAGCMLLIALRFGFGPIHAVNPLAIVAAATLIVIMAHLVLTMNENQILVKRTSRPTPSPALRTAASCSRTFAPFSPPGITRS